MKGIEVNFIAVDFEVDNERTSGPIDRANDVVEWLKLNKPDDVDEIDALVKMVTEFKPDDEYSVGYYGIRETYGVRLMFGPRNMLFLSDDILVGYFLDLLEGLRDEMKVKELT